MKNNKLTIVIVILVILGLIAAIVASKYNNLVDLKEGVTTEYSNLDAALQRRADLIPNLVSTVKGFTKQESEIIEKVTSARAALSGAKSIDEKSSANEQLSTSLNQLLVIVENYPELKSNENFIQLSDELAGTEGRINQSRRDYNDAVKKFNTAVKKFPGNLIAGMFNFDEAEYFEAEEGSKDVPEVSFD